LVKAAKPPALALSAPSCTEKYISHGWRIHSSFPHLQEGKEKGISMHWGWHGAGGKPDGGAFLCKFSANVTFALHIPFFAPKTKKDSRQHFLRRTKPSQ
jgi:hypothetical protein